MAIRSSVEAKTQALANVSPPEAASSSGRGLSVSNGMPQCSLPPVQASSCQGVDDHSFWSSLSDDILDVVICCSCNKTVTKDQLRGDGAAQYQLKRLETEGVVFQNFPRNHNKLRESLKALKSIKSGPEGNRLVEKILEGHKEVLRNFLGSQDAEVLVECFRNKKNKRSPFASLSDLGAAREILEDLTSSSDEERIKMLKAILLTIRYDDRRKFIESPFFIENDWRSSDDYARELLTFSLAFSKDDFVRNRLADGESWALLYFAFSRALNLSSQEDIESLLKMETDVGEKSIFNIIVHSLCFSKNLSASIKPYICCIQSGTLPLKTFLAAVFLYSTPQEIEGIYGALYSGFNESERDDLLETVPVKLDSVFAFLGVLPSVEKKREYIEGLLKRAPKDLLGVFSGLEQTQTKCIADLLFSEDLSRFISVWDDSIGDPETRKQCRKCVLAVILNSSDDVREAIAQRFAQKIFDASDGIEGKRRAFHAVMQSISASIDPLTRLEGVKFLRLVLRDLKDKLGDDGRIQLFECEGVPYSGLLLGALFYSEKPEEVDLTDTNVKYLRAILSSSGEECVDRVDRVDMLTARNSWFFRLIIRRIIPFDRTKKGEDVVCKEEDVLELLPSILKNTRELPAALNKAFRWPSKLSDEYFLEVARFALSFSEKKEERSSIFEELGRVVFGEMTKDESSAFLERLSKLPYGKEKIDEAVKTIKEKLDFLDKIAKRPAQARKEKDEKKKKEEERAKALKETAGRLFGLLHR